MKAYIFTKYESDKRDYILEKKVIISNKNRFEIMKLDPLNGTHEWEECDVEFQPERLNPEDHTDAILGMICDSLNTTNGKEGRDHDPKRLWRLE